MELLRALAPTTPVMAYGSRDVGVVRLAQSRGSAATLIRLGPDGLLGRHRAPVDQVVLAIGGEGWVAGPDEVPEPLRAGDAVRWAAGEEHAAGSERGLTLLAHEARDLSLGDADVPGWNHPLIRARVARVVGDLARARSFYADAIGLPVVSSFTGQGWSGVILGLPDRAHQLELAAHPDHEPVRGGTDDLLVLTYPDRAPVEALLERLDGPSVVRPANPWWHERSHTVLDPDGQRVTLAWA